MRIGWIVGLFTWVFNRGCHVQTLRAAWLLSQSVANRCPRKPGGSLSSIMPGFSVKDGIVTHRVAVSIAYGYFVRRRIELPTFALRM
ncbi:hypothetical protein QFZ96_005656 [Paraburkholderia youngii]